MPTFPALPVPRFLIVLIKRPPPSPLPPVLTGHVSSPGRVLRAARVQQRADRAAARGGARAGPPRGGARDDGGGAPARPLYVRVAWCTAALHRVFLVGVAGAHGGGAGADAGAGQSKIIAEIRAAKEQQAAVRFEKLVHARESVSQEQRRRDADKTREYAEKAKAGRVAAIKRVKESRERRQVHEAEFEQRRRADFEQRAAALAELKKSMDAAADKIQGQNAQRAKRLKAVEAKREAEKSEILAAGGNPYAVWRQEDRERELARAADGRRRRMKEQENALLQQIMEEDAQRRERLAEEERAKQVQREFQREMGGQARQARVQKYMTTRTVGGHDILDPTGREHRIYPSKATVLMDWKFGLGVRPHPEGAAPGEDVPPGFPRGYEAEDPAGVPGEGWRATQKDRLIDKVLGKNPGATFNTTLLGSRSLDDSLRRGAGGAPGDEEAEEPAADAAAPAEEGAEAEPLPEATASRKAEVHAVPEFSGIWDESKPVQSAGGSRWGGSLSKLEQQYMAQAMSRKKAGYGWIEPQVVWGKTFAGTAFVPSEKGRDVSAIVFKDFEPGRVYKRKVTLTNASYSFNTFKLLALPDKVKDFFEISYTHPGALSPGLTCDLKIKFEPKINEDIDEYIPLLCQTGPQNIPLRCLTKKVAVESRTPELEMDVIRGESLTRQIVLVHHGALDAPFTIRQLREVPRQESLEADVAAAVAGGAFAEDQEPALAYEREGVARGYSTTRVSVTLTPEQPGVIDVPLVLVFPKGLSAPQSPDVYVLLRCHAFDVPVYVEHEVIDMRCCNFGQTYSQVTPRPPPPPSRATWIRLVPPSVLTGHVSYLLPYSARAARQAGSRAPQRVPRLAPAPPPGAERRPPTHRRSSPCATAARWRSRRARSCPSACTASSSSRPTWSPPPSPLPCTNWTRLVPPSVLTGHVSFHLETCPVCFDSRRERLPSTPISKIDILSF